MKSKKVIIIDDSSSVRVQLKEWLENQSVEVFEENDGYSGFEKIKALENSLDLIIVDLNMPELDGFSMLKMLKGDKLASSIPKIILTTEIPKIFAKKVKEETENVKAWAIKPINKTRLDNIIKKIYPDWDFS
ncbi:response regulator [Bacteriovoracales bacterium]|nr:response regulator [Bacteriovoracales bacterium]